MTRMWLGKFTISQTLSKSDCDRTVVVLLITAAEVRRSEVRAGTASTVDGW